MASFAPPVLLTQEPAIARISMLLDQQRLSRVAEGTGPRKPQQPGPRTKVLTPAQWGEIRSSTDRNPGH
jgi:hypothetical protein